MTPYRRPCLRHRDLVESPSSGLPVLANTPLVSVARVNDRVALRAGIPPFYVMDVWLAAAERQRTHGDLVNLSAGQPSAGAPAAVRAAAKEALDNTVLGYTVALGIPELRTAIASSYADRHGLVVGDRVAIASPGYPCYRNILSALGCEVVEIPCGPDTRFQPTARMLADLDPPVQGVIVASPATAPTNATIAATSRIVFIPDTNATRSVPWTTWLLVRI